MNINVYNHIKRIFTAWTSFTRLHILKSSALLMRIPALRMVHNESKAQQNINSKEGGLLIKTTLYAGVVYTHIHTRSGEYATPHPSNVRTFIHRKYNNTWLCVEISHAQIIEIEMQILQKI